MTQATLELIGDAIELRCKDVGIAGESRPLGPESPFTAWARRYRQALRRTEPAEALLEIGQDMYRWLDGDHGWMERLLIGAQPPLIFELWVSSLQPSEAELEFLEAPWELVAKPDGEPLAGRADVLFGPVRRMGPAGAPREPSRYRVSIVFMAAAPERLAPLSFEDEEAAILDATGSIGVDLTVEESGSLEWLTESMAARKPVDVLHVSCHGTIEPGESTGQARPVLLLESEVGEKVLTSADALVSELGANLPERLAFVSACSTAATSGADTQLVGSLAATLVRRGCPATLGWAGPVGDTEATYFAAALYGRLSHKAPLEEAVARARLDLIEAIRESSASREPVLPFLRDTRLRVTRAPHGSRDWHLARLYLGTHGGGALTRGTRARGRKRRELGHREFLNTKGHEVRVASRDEFVGRRRALQKVLREMRQPEHAGVLIHGLGRQGKSSLAARVANRLSDHELVVVFGRYDAAAILDALQHQASTREVVALCTRERDEVRERPGCGAARDPRRPGLPARNRRAWPGRTASPPPGHR
jgi:hypothetical protein